MQVVGAQAMEVGRKGGGKHWTRAEIERRRAAAQQLKRKAAVKLDPPEWVKEDLTVFRIWSTIVKHAKGLDLLDNLDANALATYCKLEAAKEKAAREGDIALFDRLAKTSLSYARALGLTPEARARLAKAVADNDDDPNADLFD